MMDGYRRAAMRLRGLCTEDRAWLLDQLEAEERERVAALIAELDVLDPDGNMPLLADLLQSDLLQRVPFDPAHSLLSGPALIVAQARPDKIARVFANEPDWLVSQVCAISRWPWLPSFLDQLDRARAMHIGALVRKALPLGGSLDEALVAAVATRLETEVHRNGFDTILSDEQSREKSSGGLRQRFARWRR
jgi:hypothetical protein